MELVDRMADLFKAKDVVDKPRDTNSVMELNTLQHQLNLHLKNKQGLKFKKVSLVYGDKSYDSDKFGLVIDKEIVDKTANKKFRSLPMYMKWNYLQAYFEKNDITDKSIIEDIKAKLSQNTLDVKYENHEILEIYE